MDDEPLPRPHHWEITPPRNRKLAPSAYQTAGQSCFFTLRTAPGRSPFVGSRADIVVACLLEQRIKSSCQLDVYCIMPDHVHLIVTPIVDGASSLQYTNRFKGWCSRMLRLDGWQGEVWQRRSYDHLLRTEDSLERIAAYILANPVRRGLCERPEDYPWSGIPSPIPPPAAP